MSPIFFLSVCFCFGIKRRFCWSNNWIFRLAKFELYPHKCYDFKSFIMCRSRALIGLNNQNDYRSENATHKNPQPNVVYIFCNSFFVVVFTFGNSGLCSFYRLLVIHILLILFASCKNGQKCVTAYSWPCSFCPTLLNQSSIYL